MPDSEPTAQNFLESYGLSAERFSKSEQRAGKTPDFKVFRGRKLVFYCEVKNSERDSWLDNQMEDAAKGEIIGGFRADPTFNRLTAHIHKARKQFDAVNPDESYPNILVIHNEDDHIGFSDLLAVTTGNFYAESGAVEPIYKNYSHGRASFDIARIHLFVWLDEHKPFRLFFNMINDRHLLSLCEEFGSDPGDLKQFYRDGT